MKTDYKHFDFIVLEENVPYLFRAQHSDFKSVNSNYGAFTILNVDVWLPNLSADGMQRNLIERFNSGEEPIMLTFKVTESFANMWMELGMKSNDVFIIRKLSQISKTQRKFYYFQIKGVSGTIEDKTYDTRGKTMSMTARNDYVRTYLDGDNVHYDTSDSQEYLIEPSELSVILTEKCMIKAQEILAKLGEYRIEDVITLGRHFYFETVKQSKYNYHNQ